MNNQYNKFNSQARNKIFTDKRDLKRAKEIAKKGDRNKMVEVSEYNIINIFCKLLRTDNEFTKKFNKRVNELIDEKIKN